jgi:PAS domain S-box-containing protein
MTKRNCRKKIELLNISWRLRIISFGCIVLLSTEVDAHQFPLVDTTSLKIDTIYIASEPDYPPFCFVDQSGKAAGFAIDLFLASAKAIGTEVVIKVGIWDVIKQDLAIGRIDALPLVGRTPEREELFDFTIPFLSLHGAVFVRRNSSGINSIHDLYGKEIVVMKGDNAEEFILREKITEKLFTTNTFEEAFNNLANGEHDALLTQRITGLKLLEEMKLKSVVPLDFSIPGFRQDFCFAVKQGDVNLLNQLNEGLSIVIANNVYDQIHAKWFGPVESGKIRLIDALKKAFLFFIMMVFIASLFFVFTLRRLVRVRTKRLNEEISEHKRLLKELETKQLQLTESETQIRLLLNSTAEGIYGIDLLGNSAFINKSALNMLGYESADEILGQNMHHLIHHTKTDGTTCPIDECKIFQAFREGKGTHCEDELLWRKNGTSFPAEYFSYPIFDGDQITGSVVAFWDISDRIKSRDELLKLKNRLEEIVAQWPMDLQEMI